MEKTACVAGGASFIGSHLVEKLLEKNFQVSVIDDLSSGRIVNLHAVKDRIVFHKFNIKENPKLLLDILKNCDNLYHLANIHGGRYFIDNHPAQCCTNMAIDNLIFEAAVNAGVKHVQFVSSACVYSPKLQKKNEWSVLKEEYVDYSNLTTADGEYGLAKLMGEVSAQSFRREYGLNGSIVRLSSVYGPRENETHSIIALIAKALIKQDPYEIYGDGTQIRDFTFVDDIVSAMILASEKITNFTPINLGTDEKISINEVMKIIFERLNWHPKVIKKNMSMPQGPHTRIVDSHLSEKLLGLKKWTPIKEGIEKTIDWYANTSDSNFLKKNLEMILKERYAHV